MERACLLFLLVALLILPAILQESFADSFPIKFHFPGKDVLATTETSTIEFSFNPQEYVVLKSTPWKHHDTPSVDIPNFEFTIGEGMTMKMDLFFDTSESQTDVSKLVEKIQSLAQVNPEKHRPPLCLFTWGSIQFKCVLESFNVRYTLFLDDGTPVRAVMNTKLTDVKPTNERLNSHTMKKADALELLDASDESIPLLRSYQTSSFHDVVEQLFGDLDVDDDTDIPIDDVSSDTSLLDVIEPDVPLNVIGFKVEISGTDGKSADNRWETVSGGSLNIEVSDSSVGSDQFHTTTPGHKFLDEIQLRGPMTDKRKPISDWISDGTLDKCNECKNVKFSFFDESGNILLEDQLVVIDSYYFRNQVFLLYILDERLHATVFDILRTDHTGNPYYGAPRIFVVLPTSAPAFMPVVISGSGFADPTVPFINNVPSVSLFNFGTQNIPLIGSISVGVTIVPPAAPLGASAIQIEYLGQKSNPFPFSVN
jgi:hypothetical protein